MCINKIKIQNKKIEIQKYIKKITKKLIALYVMKNENNIDACKKKM